MAIYHLSTKIISRSKGKSSVASSAYRSGEKLYNKRDGLTHDYTKRKDVIYKVIFKPENAPNWVLDRERLWNEVEQIEKSKNSQLAREIDIALPIELNTEKQIELLNEYVINNFVKSGMVADVVIHDKNNGNPHAHIMLTMRPFDENGEWGAKAKKEYILDKKGNKIYSKNGNAKSRKIETTNWNKKETLEYWREQWARYTNKALEKENLDIKIDHRSYEEQGIEKIPTIHEGHIARAMENKGVETEKGNKNRQIKKENRMIENLNRQINIQYQKKGILNERKDNRFRNENRRDRVRNYEMEQGHIGHINGTDDTARERVELLKNIAREKRERDRKEQERIERENRKRLEQERQKSNTQSIGRIISYDREL